MTSTNPPARLDYHRQAVRIARPRWWRPILVLTLAASLFMAGTVVLMLALVVLAMAVPGLQTRVDAALDSADLSDPLAATMMLALIILFLPAALLAVRLAGGRAAGTLSSVDGSIRRRLLLRCLGLATLLTVPVVLVSVTLEGGWHHAAVTDRTVPIVALALLVVPLQAAAEEYLFRGLLMQTIGAWLRHPAFAIVIPVPLFTLGHDYDVVGMVDVAIFGLAMGWLTWRTGGLEAAIGLHVATNAVLIGLGGFGLVDLTSANGTVTGLVCSVCLMGGYAWLVRSWADPGADEVGSRDEATRTAALPQGNRSSKRSGYAASVRRQSSR